jgi:hypothetical protein
MTPTDIRPDVAEIVVEVLVALVLVLGWLAWRLSGEYVAHPEVERLMANIAARRKERADPGPSLAEIPVRVQRLTEATPEELECPRRG